MSTLGKSLAGSLGGAVWGKAAAMLCGMLTFAILARHLGAAGLGEYRTVLTLLAFASMMFELGLYKVTLRLISEPGEDHQIILGNAYALRIIASTSAVVTLAVVVRLSHLDPAIVLGVLVGGVGYIGWQACELGIGLFQQRLVQHRAALAEAAGAVTTLVAVYLLSFTSAGPTAMLAAMSFGWLVALLISWRLARRLIPFVPRLDPAVARRLLVAGLPFIGSGLLAIVHVRGDILMLALLSDVRAVGLYDVAAKIYELLSAIPYIFGGLLVPLLVADYRQDPMSSRRLQAAVAMTVLVSVPIVVAVVMHAEDIATLLGGAAFEESGPILRLLIASVAFGAVSQVIRLAAMARDEQRTVLKAEILPVLAALAAYVTLIPVFGSMGAAAGKLLGDVLILLFTVILLRRKLDPAVLRATPAAAVAGLALGGLLTLGNVLHAHWIVACVVSGLVVAAALLATPFVRGEIAVLVRPTNEAA